jgi:cysteine synthase A
VIARDILGAIGNTPLVQLRRVVPAGCARILVKVEGQNPSGSMKDRIAAAMISAAERDGRLEPGYTVVEYTGGSTGASLALICAVKGYRLNLVTSDAFSAEKRAQMTAYGAELTVVPSEDGGVTKALIQRMISVAKGYASDPRTFWADQLNNPDSEEGYGVLGEELWSQSSGRIDAFVQSVGASHSLRGVARALRSHDATVGIAAVEPAESAVLSGGAPGTHRIEGIGIGYPPPLWDPSLVDDVVPVSTEAAESMARRLAREEALFAGTSSGANVVAAIQLGIRLGARATVATLLVDNGLKYVSTPLYKARLNIARSL